MNRALNTILEFQERWNRSGLVSGRPIRNHKPTNHRFWPKAMCNLGITMQNCFGHFLDYFNDSAFDNVDEMTSAVENEARRLAALNRKGLQIWEM